MLRWVEELSGDIRHILDHISAAGGHAWLVGGCVRDVVSAKIPREVDVTTTLLPERVMEVRCLPQPQPNTDGFPMSLPSSQPLSS
jgi:tRNA nucleotidyltransferase/poly(A) polymerase